MGLILGSKLWFDFSAFVQSIGERDPFELKCCSLSKEIALNTPDKIRPIAASANVSIDDGVRSGSKTGSGVVQSKRNATHVWDSIYLNSMGIRMNELAFGDDGIDEVCRAELKMLLNTQQGLTSSPEFIKFLIQHVVRDTASALCLTQLLRHQLT